MTYRKHARTQSYKESPQDAYKDAGLWKPAQPSDTVLRTGQEPAVRIVDIDLHEQCARG